MHYLPKKMEEGGPRDGSAPGKVAEVERSVELYVEYPEIERELLRVELRHPEGDEDMCRENNRRWREVLNRFLVGGASLHSINGAAGTGAVTAAWTKKKGTTSSETQLGSL